MHTDVNLLAIDQGNTNCRLTVFRSGKIEATRCLSGSMTVEQVAQTAEEYGVFRAIYCSVAKVDVRLVESLRLLFGDDNILVFTHHTRVPLQVEYATPETLGLDRVAAATGAASLYPGESLLVVDAGTAITIDAVTADGIYKGGRISPGLSLRFKALHEATGRLPLVDTQGDLPFIGYDTETSMRSGVVGGIVAEIADVAIRGTGTGPFQKILLTGGDGEFIAGQLLKRDTNTLFNPDLLALGLKEIYTCNENI